MTEEREHLQKLIELHRANLQHYEELEAKYSLDCPIYVKNAKEEARKGLAEARARLAALEGGAPGAEPSIPAIPQNLPPRGEFIGRQRNRPVGAVAGDGPQTIERCKMPKALEQTPSHFWEDSKWFCEHGEEITHQYPNQWVAIYNQKVVAVYKSGEWVKLDPELPVEPESCFTFFIEDGIRVY